MNIPIWLRPILLGGIADIAAMLSDNHDFNWTGSGVLHLIEVFIGGAAAAILLQLKGGSTASPTPKQ